MAKSKNPSKSSTSNNGPAPSGRSAGASKSAGAAAGNGRESGSRGRLPVQKTYKIYVGGKFPRSESGRYYPLNDAAGKPLGNICLCSRKDVRDAVSAARSALGDWACRTAFNRSQILYRIAEMLEGRAEQFTVELKQAGLTTAAAHKEVTMSVDRLIYFAGWCDKYQQLFSSVNPVASSHFNFTVPEPTGVVGIVAPHDSPLLGLVSLIAPAIAGGNTTVVLAAENAPLSAVTLGEVLNSSDVPGGTVNILTGSLEEMLPHLSLHMDVNALVYGISSDDHPERLKLTEEESVANLKRVVEGYTDWFDQASATPYQILDTQEFKTTWHPIESVKAAGSGY